MSYDFSNHEQSQTANTLNIASDIAGRYELSSLEPLIESCRQLSESDDLNVAVVGRFKAGKSSFLNHFLEREILPVGVVPVTSVITEIGYGPNERAMVHFLNGETEMPGLDAVRSFIAEKYNPGNRKGVSTVEIELPNLEQFRALRFVDMPGLESTVAHNSETSLNWLPRIGLALVAVSIDAPLSKHDIALVRSLYEYTPKVSLLLTKIDLLSEIEQQEVVAFVTEQLNETFVSGPQVFPYSIKPGYEHLRMQIKSNLIANLLVESRKQRHEVLERKLQTVVRECHEYLSLALRSTETVYSQREELKRQVLGEKEDLEDVKSQLLLMVQHAAAGARTEIAKHLDSHRAQLQRRLISELSSTFPNWTSSFAFALESYECWLGQVLSEALTAISAVERNNLLLPLDKLKSQVFRSLQNFRERISNQVMEAFGIPFHTTEQEIQLREPHTPDIHIGRIFDRSWELLSPVLSMSLVGPLVRRHFSRKLPYMIEKNLSRLATQWDESIRGAMAELITEVDRRLEESVAIIARLVSSASHDAPQIREDIDRLQLARQPVFDSTEAR